MIDFFAAATEKLLGWMFAACIVASVYLANIVAGQTQSDFLGIITMVAGVSGSIVTLGSVALAFQIKRHLSRIEYYLRDADIRARKNS